MRFVLVDHGLANWYRPGASTHDGFVNLYAEVAIYFQEVSGIFIAGDINIHHKRWLRLSNGNTQIGEDMKKFCDYYALSQLVRDPTRLEYLLDLVMTDVRGSSSSVLPSIADHHIVLSRLPIPEVLEKKVVREVWHLRQAKWTELETELANYDWSKLDSGSPEDALDHFMHILWSLLVKYITRKNSNFQEEQ